MQKFKKKPKNILLEFKHRLDISDQSWDKMMQRVELGEKISKDEIVRRMESCNNSLKAYWNVSYKENEVKNVFV